MDMVSELWGSMAITGKGVVVTLIALSIYSYVVMVDRIAALSADGKNTRDLADQLGSSTDAGQILNAARAAGEGGKNSLADVVVAGLQEFEMLRSDEQPAPVVSEGVDEALSRQLDVSILALRSRLSGMATISGVAPFLGLFGTVTGLISAFRGIADTGSGGLATVSGGISEALVTTVIGLFVAIPALWAYNFFMNKIDMMAVEIDNSATRIVTRTVRRALRASAA